MNQKYLFDLATEKWASLKAMLRQGRDSPPWKNKLIPEIKDDEDSTSSEDDGVLP